MKPFSAMFLEAETALDCFRKSNGNRNQNRSWRNSSETYMKKIIAVIGIAFAAMVINSSAQTNLPTNQTIQFVDSLEGYLTSFNTNYTFTNVTVELTTGYKQVTGVNAASYLDGQYDLSDGLNFDVSLQFSGVGSAFNAYEAGIGYNIVRHYDTELNVVLLGGYDSVAKSGVIEPGVTLKKKMTVNTYTEVGISLPVFFKGSFNSNPTFRAGVGFTF